MTDTLVHRCAATGVYVGKNGGSATLTRCDILENGLGAKSGIGPLADDGIGSGHSGVYLEKGSVTIRDCNVSGNR